MPSTTNVPSTSQLNDEDKLVLYLIAGYTAAIFILWNLPYIKHVLTPFKLVATGLHELGHATACKLTGGHVDSISIEGDTGGVTRMRGGIQCCTLPAGKF